MGMWAVTSFSHDVLIDIVVTLRTAHSEAFDRVDYTPRVLEI